MDSSTASEEQTSKWSSLKHFYENFKDELSDGDFSDCEEEHLEDDAVEFISQEEFATSKWQTMDTEVVWMDEAPVVIVIDDEESEDILSVPTKADKPRKRLNVTSEASSQKSVLNVSNKPFIIHHSSSFSNKPTAKVKKVFSEVPKPKPRRIIPKPTFKFTCERCSKGSNKPNFLDQHTTVQCDRALSIAERQTNIKKTFSV